MNAAMRGAGSWRRAAGIGLGVYAAISALAIGFVLVVYRKWGMEGLDRIAEQGPISYWPITAMTVLMAWALVGSVLVLLWIGMVNRGNALTVIAFYLFAFLYLGVMRERPLYGDVMCYIKGAFNLARGEPFHDWYLYPPLWATILQPFVAFGMTGVEVACIFLNACSLFLFFFVLRAALLRYSFRPVLATVATFVALCANTSVLRNTFYAQINLHVANCVLLSLLLYPRHRFASALMLSLAVHLKVSPVLFVLLFLWVRDWRWLVQFALVTGGIVLLTSVINGFQYYGQFVHNLGHYQDYRFRSTSFDTVLGATLNLLYLDAGLARTLSIPLKALLLGLSLLLTWKLTAAETFYSGDRAQSVVHHGYLVLAFPMIMASPCVWIYHYCWAIVTVLVMFKRIRGVGQLLLYLAAYLSLFLVPAFDLYPVSFHRVAAVAVCYYLLIRFLHAQAAEPNWFELADKRLGYVLAFRPGSGAPGQDSAPGDSYGDTGPARVWCTPDLAGPVRPPGHARPPRQGETR